MLVAKNLLGQLTELVIYDDIKSGEMYADYPITAMVLTSIGLGALKVCGQVAGKSIGTDPASETTVSQGLNFGMVGVATLLAFTEWVRENLTSSDDSRNTLRLGALVAALFVVSASQSIAVKKLTHAEYPYFAAVRQMTSVGVSFALNNQLEVGDPWFSSSDANLVYRSGILASVKIAGYLAGRSYALNENEALAHNHSETVPLLAPREEV